jgi:hypothetical protein
MYVLIVAYLIREIIQFVYVWHRVQKRKYIKISKLNFSPAVNDSSVRRIYDEHTSVDTETHLVQEQPKWRVYDAEFSFFRKTKYGRYKSKIIYYTVVEMDLQRVVPHIIFDSKIAKGKQFRFNYLQSQRVSFEGNFDDVFEAYAPQTYHIDTLSFISPEVLEALLNVADCDIEFIGNKLMCFAPLLHQKEIEDLKNRTLKLHASVDDNLDTYIDERLSGKYRREAVTEFAKELLQNPMKYLPLTILTGIGTAGLLYLSSKWGWQLFFDKAPAVVWVTFIFTAYKMFKLMYDNNKKEKAFFNLRQAAENTVIN